MLRKKNSYAAESIPHEVGKLGLSEAARRGANGRMGRRLCRTTGFASYATVVFRCLKHTIYIDGANLFPT